MKSEFQELIGKSIEQAQKIIAEKNLGLETRVVERDGRSYSLNCDLRSDRINFVIVNKKITEAYKG